MRRIGLAVVLTLSLFTAACQNESGRSEGTP